MILDNLLEKVKGVLKSSATAALMSAVSEMVIEMGSAAAAWVISFMQSFISDVMPNHVTGPAVNEVDKEVDSNTGDEKQVGAQKKTKKKKGFFAKIRSALSAVARGVWKIAKFIVNTLIAAMPVIWNLFKQFVAMLFKAMTNFVTSFQTQLLEQLPPVLREGVQDFQGHLTEVASKMVAARVLKGPLEASWITVWTKMANAGWDPTLVRLSLPLSGTHLIAAREAFADIIGSEVQRILDQYPDSTSDPVGFARTLSESVAALDEQLAQECTDATLQGAEEVREEYSLPYLPTPHRLNLKRKQFNELFKLRLLTLDRGPWIQDPASRILDPDPGPWIRLHIQDPGSRTLDPVFWI